MYLKKIEVDVRKTLIILDDRKERHPTNNMVCTAAAVAGCLKELIVLKQTELTCALTDMIARQEFGKDILYVFLGRSAAAVREEIEERHRGRIFENGTVVSVHAERLFDTRHNPHFRVVGELCPEQSVCLQIRTIVVIDDVISSGGTVRALYQRNYHKFPLAKWRAHALLSRKEKVKGYTEISTPLLVPLDHGLKVPVNSLTTLMCDDAIAESYARKHFSYPERFLGALAALQVRRVTA